MPQDRTGLFSTQVFERYQRSEKALVWALIQMYVEGVSTRKVEAITEELCGAEFSPATVSRLVATLDDDLEKFAKRRLRRSPLPGHGDAGYRGVRSSSLVAEIAG